jgi:hypothetical protein
MTVVGNTLYFSAWCGNYDKLFKYSPGDPLVTTEKRLTDINPSGPGDNISDVVVVGQTLYFAANSVKGRQLYRYIPGSPVITATDALNAPRTSGNSVFSVKLVGSSIYFGGLDSNGHKKLFRYNPGDALVTQPVAELYSGVDDFTRDLLVVSGTTIYIQSAASSGALDDALFRFKAGTFSLFLTSSIGGSDNIDMGSMIFTNGEVILSADQCGGNNYSCMQFLHLPQ